MSTFGVMLPHPTNALSTPVSYALSYVLTMHVLFLTLNVLIILDALTQARLFQIDTMF